MDYVWRVARPRRRFAISLIIPALGKTKPGPHLWARVVRFTPKSGQEVAKHVTSTYVSMVGPTGFEPVTKRL